MIDPVTGLIVGGVGAAVNAGLSIYDRIRAEEALAEQKRLYEDLGLTMPSENDLAVKYGTGAYTGDLTTSNLGRSELGGITEDSDLAAAQMEALNQIRGVASNQGFTQGDMARMKIANANAAQQNRAAQDAVMQNARARGIAGSGMEMMNRQIAQQGAAQNRAMSGAQLMASADDRALQAMAQGGQMAGNISDRQYGRAANSASANDSIARFNLANNQAVRERNLNAQQTQANNAAQAANQTAASRAGARQTAFGNRAGVTAGRAGVAGNQAQRFDQWGQDAARTAGNFLGGAAASYWG
jgi:hypothetical protein